MRVILTILSLGLTACIAKKALEPIQRFEKKKQDDTHHSSDSTPEKPNTKLSADDQKIAEDVSLYADQCKRELGLPDITLSPWNCLDGSEVPVAINGSRIDASNYNDVSKRKIGCDHPAWLGDEPCANYAFVQKRTLAPNVEAVLLCRSRHFFSYKDKAERLADFEADKSTDNFNLLYAFESLGMIWTNTKTGKTCFFDYVGKVYGGYVPSPDDRKLTALDDLPNPKPPADMQVDGTADVIWKKNGARTWRRPIDVVNHDNCVRCHDTGAFKSSPWIEQVMKLPANSKQVPLLVVGKVFEQWKTKLPIKAIDTTPIINSKGEAEPQICTSCHRIGSLATCDQHLDYSIGRKTPGIVSDLGRKFFHQVWMPPPGNTDSPMQENELRDAWQEKYGKHVEKLKCCCAKPDATGCLSQVITDEPLQPFKVGNSSETCM